MEEEVHPGDSRGKQVALLPVQLKVSVLLALVLELDGCDQKHPTCSAGRVVHRLTRLGREQSSHQPNQRPVRVELGSRMAAVISEFLDEEFVGDPEFILRDTAHREVAS